MNRLAHLKHAAQRLLAHQPRLLNALDIRPRRTISNWRLVGVHLDDRIVHTHAHQRADHMLHRMHLHTALGQRGGPLDSLHILHFSVNEWLIFQINTAKTDARMWLAGLQRQRHFLPGMERSSGQTGRLGNRMLKINNLRHG